MTQIRGGWRTVCAFEKPSVGNKVLNEDVMEKNRAVFSPIL